MKNKLLSSFERLAQEPVVAGVRRLKHPRSPGSQSGLAFAAPALKWTLALRRSSWFLLAALAAFTASPRAPAQTGWGSAVQFDGVDDYVSIPLTLPENGTIEMWYYVEPFAGVHTIFDNSAGPDHWEMWTYTTGDVNFRIQAQDTHCKYYLSDLDGPNHWYHFAVTWRKQGTNVDYGLCINGVLRAQVTNQTWVDPGAYFYLAGGNPGNVKGKGQIDEVRIWNMPRTTNQIQADMWQPPSGTESGLLAYYRFDEGAGTRATNSAIATGSALDGTLVSSPTWVPSTVPPVVLPTIWGSALQSETNQYLKVDPFISFPTTEITAELWMRTLSTNDGTLFSYAVSFTNESQSLVTNANEFLVINTRDLSVAVGNTGSGQPQPPIMVNDGAWHHVAATWRSADGSLNVYVDGQNRYSASNLKTGYSLHDGGFLVLGQDQDSLGGRFESHQAFEGEMDEVRLWNTARSVEDIRATMRQPLTGADPGLVAYWRFDEADGPTAYDATTNHLDGTLVDGPARVTSRVPESVNTQFSHLCDCQAIHAADPNAPDGEYLITNTNGQRFAVYCHDMAGSPQEYLTLVYTDGSYNYSSFPPGTWTTGTEVKTYFYKVRLDPQTLVVDTTIYPDGDPSRNRIQLRVTPSVTTVGAEFLPEARLLLQGTVNPKWTDTWAWFEWGTDTGYGNTTEPAYAGSGHGAVHLFHQALVRCFLC